MIQYWLPIWNKMAMPPLPLPIYYKMAPTLSPHYSQKDGNDTILSLLPEGLTLKKN